MLGIDGQDGDAVPSVVASGPEEQEEDAEDTGSPRGREM